ncbi:MAG: glycosyltransferase [Nitrospirae bacterium]|nr:glycosyltransferase [Nitrospirota bacterium]
MKSLKSVKDQPSDNTVNLYSVIVPAYNEEKNIKSKIETLRQALKMATGNFEILIGSDGSTDRTTEVVRTELEKMNDPRWSLVEYPNEGKCRTINKLVSVARGEVIISTDADIPLPTDSINKIVEAFNKNNSIGCLSCVPCFQSMNIGSQKSYWDIEAQIRTAESELGKLIVVTGMLYAYKKNLFVEMPDGVMADDLWIPLNILLQGNKSIQIDDLRVPYEKTDEATEVYRRKRVISGGMDVVRRIWKKLKKSPSILFLVLMHKINRWSLPVWLILMFLSIGMLMPIIFLVYIAGVLLLMWKLGRRRFMSLVFAVISPIISFAEVIRSADFARWEHTRKN